jgi:hypothetical protein
MSTLARTRRLTVTGDKIRTGDILYRPLSYPGGIVVETIVTIGHDAFGSVLDIYGTGPGQYVTLSGTDVVRVLRTYA